ncbi:hypothetical protein BD779DRAFT_113522 [Infundibulicybe gibba]|nr:hypothetical protein BD779DRAFT_113522 [Infundibulicybe gibba]
MKFWSCAVKYLPLPGTSIVNLGILLTVHGSRTDFSVRCATKFNRDGHMGHGRGAEISPDLDYRSQVFRAPIRHSERSLHKTTPLIQGIGTRGKATSLKGISGGSRGVLAVRAGTSQHRMRKWQIHWIECNENGL